MREIYLDNAATTRVRKEVAQEMNKFMLNEYGNASSVHEKGKKARKEIDNVRKEIAKEINSRPGEVYFTSGGTESNNLAIIGLSKANKNKKTIVVSEIEHPSIIEPCLFLEKKGYKIIKIKVDEEGLIRLDNLREILDKNKDVLVVSVMHVNNIIGTIQPIDEIGKICSEKRVLFHTDAVQSFGKLRIDVRKMNIDLLSASAHKINGPKGIGLLYVREGIEIQPMVYGGGQEKGLRSGTENVPGIIGMGKALDFQNKINWGKVEKLRDKSIIELENIGGKINGSKDKRIWNNVHVSFPVNAEILVDYLSEKRIYVSTGSACESKKEKEDHVLKAIGLNKKEIDGSIRITLNNEIKNKDLIKLIREIANTLEIIHNN